ncbi:MAG: type II secretion system inner membrane protein GspF [Nitrospinota bacterium]
MPVFFYRALDARGRTHKGVIDAESSAVARERLRSQGLHPAEVRDGRPGPGGISAPTLLSRRGGLRGGEVVTITRQLATLLSAGLPVVPALSILIRQSRREAVRRLLVRVREEVNEGATLAKALEGHPRVFSPMYVSMVSAGETSGSLGLVLTRLADYLELQQNLRRRLAAALAYPALMVVVGLAVLSFLLTFVVPSVVQIFREARQELPWPTQVLIAASDLVSSYYGVALAALGILAVAGGLGLRTPAGRRYYDSFKLRLPLVGGLLRKQAIARFARTLGVLLAGGLPILQALSVAKLVLANTVLESVVERAREETRRGGSLSRALEQSGFFPPLVTDLAGAGEQVGRLDEMLLKAAEHLEREVEATIQTAMALVDPVLILMMGFVVGFVVLSILLPLFEVSQLVR